MEKQQISRQLHRLAQEEIPDTMNLWPGLQAKLKRKSKPRSFSLAHALSVFVMTMLVAVGGYAAYQTNNAPDPIAPSYGVELNLIQSSDAVTASLDWAYADETIIAVQYSVIFNPEFVAEPVYIDSLLSTRETWFPTYGSSPTLEELEDGNLKYTFNSYFYTGIENSGRESIDVRFDIVVIGANSYAPLQLQATLVPPESFTATPIPFGQIESTVPPDSNFTATPTSASSLATSTPFGEFEPTVPPPDMQTIEPSLIPPMSFTPVQGGGFSMPYGTIPDGTYRFNFTLPIHQSRIGQASNAEVESEGRTMRVENVKVTPLQTTFELCYQYPDLLGTWYPAVAVDTGFAPSDAERYSPIIETMRAEFGKVYAADIDSAYLPWTSYNWQYNLDPFDNSNCAPLTSFAAITEEASQLDIHVDYLYRDTDPTDLAVWNNDIDFFAARGFSLVYDLERNEARDFSEQEQTNRLAYPLPIGSLMVTIEDYPDSMSLDEARSFIYQNMLKERVEGDWSFHITLE